MNNLVKINLHLNLYVSSVFIHLAFFIAFILFYFYLNYVLITFRGLFSARAGLCFCEYRSPFRPKQRAKMTDRSNEQRQREKWSLAKKNVKREIKLQIIQFVNDHPFDDAGCRKKYNS